MEGQLPVFVYGTLRPGQANYRALLAGRTSAENRGWAERLAMYSLGSFPVASPAPGGRIAGHLITLRPRVYRRVLRHLDDLEGYTGDPRTSLYIRRTWPVTAEHGPTQRAWIYVAGPDIDVAELPPVSTGDWLFRSSGPTRCSREPGRRSARR